LTLLLCVCVSLRPPSRSTLFPYTTLFRSGVCFEVPTPAEGTETILHITAYDCTLCVSRFLHPLRVLKPPAKFGIHWGGFGTHSRSEEHTSELQSRENLVCRLLLEKKKDTK